MARWPKWECSTLQELQEQLDAEQHSSSRSLLIAAAVASYLGLSLGGLAIFYCCKFRRERMKKLLAEQSAKTVLRWTNKVIVEQLQDSGEVVGPVWPERSGWLATSSCYSSRYSFRYSLRLCS